MVLKLIVSLSTRDSLVWLSKHWVLCIQNCRLSVCEKWSLIEYYTERRFFPIHFESFASAFPCIFCFFFLYMWNDTCVIISLYVLSVSLSLYVLPVSLSLSLNVSFFFSLSPFHLFALLHFHCSSSMCHMWLTRHILTASNTHRTSVLTLFSSLFSFLSQFLSFSSLSLYHSFSEYSPPITCHVFFSANRREHRRLLSFLTKVSKLINYLI